MLRDGFASTCGAWKDESAKIALVIGVCFVRIFTDMRAQLMARLYIPEIYERNKNYFLTRMRQLFFYIFAGDGAF